MMYAVRYERGALEVWPEPMHPPACGEHVTWWTYEYTPGNGEFSIVLWMSVVICGPGMCDHRVYYRADQAVSHEAILGAFRAWKEAPL